jgi:hypothetical protein
MEAVKPGKMIKQMPIINIFELAEKLLKSEL